MGGQKKNRDGHEGVPNSRAVTRKALTVSTKDIVGILYMHENRSKVLAYIIDNFDGDTNMLITSGEGIAKDMGIARNSVHMALQELEMFGIIKRSHRGCIMVNPRIMHFDIPAQRLNELLKLYLKFK